MILHIKFGLTGQAIWRKRSLKWLTNGDGQTPCIKYMLTWAQTVRMNSYFAKPKSINAIWPLPFFEIFGTVLIVFLIVNPDFLSGIVGVVRKNMLHTFNYMSSHNML